jgi:hypothetical protein
VITLTDDRPGSLMAIRIPRRCMTLLLPHRVVSLRCAKGQKCVEAATIIHTALHSIPLKPIKTIQGRMGNWTITDANLSPDNQWMIYSSITPTVHLVSTRAEAQGGQDLSDKQVALDFGSGDDDDGGVRYRSGVREKEPHCRGRSSRMCR